MNIGIACLLGVIFITLKLCGVIAWSWVWVLAPFWIGSVVALILLLIGAVGISVATSRR
jgi:hypothetical protein